MAEPIGRKAGPETGPDGKPTGFIVCYPSDDLNCIVVSTPQPGAITSTGFLSLPEPTRFHDEVLIQATQEINEVLAKVARESEEDFRKTSLHLFLAEDGPMLIWVHSMAMPMDDIRKVSGMES
jgi:hypothetical protein